MRGIDTRSEITFRRPWVGALLRLVLCSLLTWGVAPRLWAAETVEQLFGRAKTEYQATFSIPQKEQKAAALRQCIGKFQEIIRQDKQRKVSDRAYYLMAQCYHTIHDTTHKKDDLQAARKNYKTVVEKFPKSPLADDAQYLMGILCMTDNPAQAYQEFSKVCSSYPKGDMCPRASQKMTQLKGQPGQGASRPDPTTSEPAPAAASSETAESVSKGRPGSNPVKAASSPSSRTSSSKALGKAVNQLHKIQHWSGPDFTRVVLYMSDPVNFKEETTRADPKNQQPGRISLDLKNCVLGAKVNHHILVMDTFLREIHATQVDPVQARVVLDTHPLDSYRIFSMSDPFRLVVDVRGGKQKAESHAPATPPKPPSPVKLPPSAPSLAQQLGLNVRRIVVDPGHGGKDKGAISPNKTYEKDLTLAIAKELKTTLEAETGCEVVLTRTQDRYLSLEERTAFANTRKADLFISVHTNAHEDRSLHGVETYFLNLSKDKESARVAALENATSSKKISDLEAILQDLMLNTKINESSHLASSVQRQVVSTLKTRYEGVRDLGTKQAPFYVLMGAEMPSILIETAFLSNEREEIRLKDPNYRNILARAISSGISSYIRQMKDVIKAGGKP